MMKPGKHSIFLEKYLRQDIVEQNVFRSSQAEQSELPLFDDARSILPEPFWDGHEDAIKCWWKTWELAFRNLCRPEPESGLVSNFIDTAFNNCLFMWDSVFILFFGRYGARAFDFQKTLDNFYARQHDDGFICREIRRANGCDQFSRHDPAATGPNVLAISEWEHYRYNADKERLSAVFPALLAYHRWTRRYRTWPDGSYWTTGWGSGMDNQPRVPGGLESLMYHGHQSWVDANFQAILSASTIESMAKVLHRESDVQDLRDEVELLSRYVNECMWNEQGGFYADRLRDGTLSPVRTIGAYWAFMTDVVPRSRLDRMAEALEDPRLFNRFHRVPSLSADHPYYSATGDYWKGSVWPPTNYMVLMGLRRNGYDRLAREIAANHHQNVVNVFTSTSTLWENYASESVSGGKPAKSDFVGWGGTGPVAVLLEYVFGLLQEPSTQILDWEINLTEAHGVKRYPFGPHGLVDLECNARRFSGDMPLVKAQSTVPITLRIRWNGGEISHELKPGLQLSAVSSGP